MTAFDPKQTSTAAKGALFNGVPSLSKSGFEIEDAL
jgi:hypothetical protein